METVYDRIRKTRIKKDMSQDELARLCGYTHRSTIHKIEAGGIDLPLSKVEKFAEALNVTPSYLMGWSTSSCSMSCTDHEKDLIRKYRCLPPPVQNAVDTMIDAQYQLVCPRVKNEEEIS